MLFRSVLAGAGGLVGYGVLMIAVGESHLLNLSVAAAEQGRGYGRAMLRHFVDIARGAGAGRMLLEVRPSNVAARALYGAHGFSEIGLRRNYYPAAVGREDAIVLGREL